MSITIDAHVHLWDLGIRPQPWIDPVTMATINRSFSITDLEAALSSAGIDSCVLVQVLNDSDETADFIQACEQSTRIQSVVGWTDLTRTDVDSVLDNLSPLVVGIRHQALAETDPVAWFDSDAVRHGLAAVARHDMTFDVMLHWHQLPQIRATLDATPDLRVIVDHAGKPPVAEGPQGPSFSAWRSAMARIAERPLTWCKLSGLTTMASQEWTVDDLRPFVDVVLEVFGPSRVLFGSDWPVSARRGSYAGLVAAIRETLSHLGPDDFAAVFGANAGRLYSLHQG